MVPWVLLLGLELPVNCVCVPTGTTFEPDGPVVDVPVTVTGARLPEH